MLIQVGRAAIIYGFLAPAPPSMILVAAAALARNNMPSSRRIRWIQRCQELEACNCDHHHVPPESQLNQQQLQSLQRLANSMELSVSELHQRHAEYEAAVDELKEKLRNPNLPGTLKHQFHCQHRFQYGRQPLVCPTCWSYLPICLCRRRTTSSLAKIEATIHEKWCTHLGSNYDCSVVIWTHHKEWGSPSNTSSALAAVLGPSKCRMLMKGLEEHDAELQRLVNQVGDRRVVVPIVLWTESSIESTSGDNNDTNGKLCERRQFVKAEQLHQELLESSSSSSYVNSNSDEALVLLLLIALEGTWGQARRMSNKLPASVRGLSLSTEEIFGWRRQRQEYDGQSTPTTTLSSLQKSILQPLRKQKTTRNLAGDIVEAGKVCTAEAVVSALLALSVLNEAEAAALLDIAEQKVKDTAAYQGVRMVSS